MNTLDPTALSNIALVDTIKDLARRSNTIEVDLIIHLAEVDQRKLYLDLAYSSLFTFCLSELNFSEPVAHNRIVVARASRRFPKILDHLRAGDVHLTGLRVLAPHLTLENHETILVEARGKSKRDIEALVARRFPSPAVPDLNRKLPVARPVMPVASSVGPQPALALALASTRGESTGERVTSQKLAASMTVVAQSGTPNEVTHGGGGRTSDRASPESPCEGPTRAGPPSRPAPPVRPGTVEPLSAEQYKVQFTASRELSEKLRTAQDLLRHQVPDGSLAEIVGRALDLLISEVKKERFAVGRTPRRTTPESRPGSRHIPDAIKREVYERDDGQCTFVDDRGHRCAERGWLEFDHIEGFARNPTHSVASLRLRCRAHNQHAADRLYGRQFMEEHRAGS